MDWCAARTKIKNVLDRSPFINIGRWSLIGVALYKLCKIKNHMFNNFILALSLFYQVANLILISMNMRAIVLYHLNTNRIINNY